MNHQFGWAQRNKKTPFCFLFHIVSKQQKEEEEEEEEKK
jgi:hypothetical protein